jgi:hypothetical protein
LTFKKNICRVCGHPDFPRGDPGFPRGDPDLPPVAKK